MKGFKVLKFVSQTSFSLGQALSRRRAFVVLNKFGKTKGGKRDVEKYKIEKENSTIQN